MWIVLSVRPTRGTRRIPLPHPPGATHRRHPPAASNGLGRPVRGAKPRWLLEEEERQAR
ncbi:hypothetical protein GCM10011574_16980 [Microbispora bryophytorum]|uniref:Uncharacterized protein n=1 Tax=Microbispora bryophytorum TaxID=1460882 RepID=A0A8H9GW08_9ACTN|nr:hypothetical protein GCM10011574_16980 [Microbispora bryophytorum]